MDLNRLILGKSYNSTKVFRTAQHVVQAILLGFVVPALILLLIWDLTDNPNPVPGVVVIAGLVMLCFFFSYVFVVPDDLTSSATDRTLAIASKIFAYTSRGLTSEAALGASSVVIGSLFRRNILSFPQSGGGHLLYRRQAGAGELGRGLGKMSRGHSGCAADYAQRDQQR